LFLKTEKLSSQLSRSEAQAAAAQESLLRTRKELEDTRRKEVRLREKLKEILENETASDKVKDLKQANDQIIALQREVDVLQAQNSALRMAVESGEQPPQFASSSSAHAGRTIGGGSPGPAGGESKMEGPEGGVFGRSKGHTLGEAPASIGLGPGGAPAAGGVEDYRQQMHAKWENEKKLQKRLVHFAAEWSQLFLILCFFVLHRVSVLEKRLQEKIDEIDDLQAQLQRARDTTQHAVAAREEMHKKVSGTAKLAHEARKLTIEDLVAVKEV
jgi:chromosome segregation ATPase